MAKFITSSELNYELEKIFRTAEKLAVIISPYIKLHAKIKDVLKSHKNDPKFHLVIVFGKNDDDLGKSIAAEDLEFFKEFCSVEIRHEPRLHAKYYANDDSSILSSMNLYDYSFNNNIEFGVLTYRNDEASSQLDQSAYDYFDQVIENSELLYHKEPEIESKMFGLKTIHKDSHVILDILDERFKKIQKVATTNNNRTVTKKGYCIRTGAEIEFDMKMPFTKKAFESWSKYSDEKYREKYCHYSGEESGGQTSFSRPVLNKNWKKVMVN
ncbi:hypothetical protein GCM10011506_03120 [Marivirga lumbricoides]|uniref:Phospholipase D-like domain-containing protein n=1 Tax=Marivirga lumbricoides TaxID=1046115 RepID=A0ABQ1L8D1_9BACT|nr:hypothetical protein GCM10011506_03120 [Marivirga lumbricoides]